MADGKHTPGPWVLDPPRMAGINDHEYHSIEAGDGVNTDRYKGFCASTFMSIEDARLIAAAPELLEALQDVLDEWVRDLTDAGEEDVEERAYVKFARATIAKATGAAS